MATNSYVTGIRRATDTDSEGILVRDITKDIWNPELGENQNAALFHRLQDKIKGPMEVKQSKFELYSKYNQQREIALSSISTPTSTTMTFTAAESRVLSPRMLLVNLRTDERVRILTVNYASGEVTTERDVGSYKSGAQNFLANDVFRILGPAREENGLPDTPKTINHNLSYNYVMTLRTPFGSSDIEINSDTVFGGPRWPAEAKEKAQQHKADINAYLWFGIRDKSTDPVEGAETVWITGGVLQHIGANYIDLSSVPLTERQMDDVIMAKAFLTGKTEKTAWCGSHFAQSVSSWAKNKGRWTINKDKSKHYGVTIAEYESAGCVLEFIVDREIFAGVGDTSLYTSGTMSNRVAVLQMDQLKFAILQNMGTKLYKDVQEPGRAGKVWEYRTTFGLHMQPGIDDPFNDYTAPEQYRNPHTLIKGFKTYV